MGIHFLFEYCKYIHSFIPYCLSLSDTLVLDIHYYYTEIKENKLEKANAQILIIFSSLAENSIKLLNNNPNMRTPFQRQR